MPSGNLSNYWTSMDFGSEEEDSIPSKTPPARVYVDPWDMENYAFMRRHLDNTPGPESLPGPTGEPASSNLYYVPANYDYRNEMHRRSSSRSRFSADSPTVFAAIDEVDFHNDHFEMPPENAPFYQHFYEDHLDRKFQVPRPSFTESGSSLSSGNENHYMYSSEPRGPTSPDASLVYVYETTPGRKRSIVALPIKERRTSSQYVKSQGMRKLSKMRSLNCPDCQLLEQAGYVSHYDLNRAAMISPPPLKPPPENFGLSQYGHLKIDYSCSWHSLDQLISHDN